MRLSSRFEVIAIENEDGAAVAVKTMVRNPTALYRAIVDEKT